MNNGYEQLAGSNVFMIYGPNMSYNIIKIYMDEFYTQRAFHRVQEHPKQSLNEEIMIIQSWRNFDSIFPKTSIFP